MARLSFATTTPLAISVALATVGCQQDDPDPADTGTFTSYEDGDTGNESIGDGDGDATASSAGDGDGTTSSTTSATGDGDGTTATTGDGDGTTTAGDGDGTTSTTGDGDGDGTTSTTGDGDGDGTTTGDGDGDGALPNEVCYLGPNRDYTVCLPVVPLVDTSGDYDYPAPLNNNPNYRAPVQVLDLVLEDPATMLAPNFRLDEFAEAFKGRWGVVHPHMVEHMQDIRDVIGPTQINSGYRPPAYNASVGGATYSRHMYGDAVDAVGINTTIAQLESLCTSNGGFLVQYTSHVHCDWRNEPVDPAFMGWPADRPLPPTLGAAMSAELVPGPDGTWTAPARGFDEGEPLRRWTAIDAWGVVIDEAVGAVYDPPPDAVEIGVVVGARVHVSIAL